jgi:hypothetical protein
MTKKKENKNFKVINDEDLPKDLQKLSKDMEHGHWNHRIIKHTSKILGRGKNKFRSRAWFGIHEIYYSGKGDIIMYTDEPVRILGDDIEDMKESIKLLSTAFEKPILIDKKLPGYKEK